MKSYSPNEIRNIAILGHSGCGKTTIVESILNICEITKRFGKVDDGNTVSDYDPEEIRRKVSINTSIIPIEWQDMKINFFDTPGYFDFVGDVKQAVRAADMILIVLDAKSGIEVGTEKAWEYAEEMGLPKMIFVNGMDDPDADLDKVIEDLKTTFGKSIAPLQVPTFENGRFTGFINVIKKEGRKYVNGRTEDCAVTPEYEAAVLSMRSMLEEAVAETDDALMEKFFEETSFEVEELQLGVKKGSLSGEVCPVVCGSAIYQIGIRVLLNSINKFLPPTKDVLPSILATNPETGENVTITCDETEPLSAFVFKTIADPYVGRLSIFKVQSGIMKKDSSPYNPEKDFTEKVSHLYIVRGKDQIEVDELKAGDIGAIAKLQYTSTGDTLCSKKRVVVFPKTEYPESLYSLIILPKGKGDEDKISQALTKILEEDKTLKFKIDKETKQSLVSGIGDTHLDVLGNKLRTRYKLEIDFAVPVVAYREMIKAKVEIRGRYKKQSGGHGQYGDVLMDFEPSGDLSKPYIFEEKIFGGSVPRQYFPAVEKGLQESVKAGPIAGYPVVGLKATLKDGSYHPVDSSEMAFKMATTMAFKDGFMKAKPTILEPIAKAEIIVPDDYTGDIMGDMNKRRGRILGMEKFKNKQKISAEVPMSEMFKYPIDLRSMTQSRGYFTMEFIRYEEVPKEIQDKIVEKRKKEKEAEK